MQEASKNWIIKLTTGKWGIPWKLLGELLTHMWKQEDAVKIQHLVPLYIAAYWEIKKKIKDNPFKGPHWWLGNVALSMYLVLKLSPCWIIENSTHKNQHPQCSYDLSWIWFSDMLFDLQIQNDYPNLLVYNSNKYCFSMTIHYVIYSIYIVSINYVKKYFKKIHIDVH